MKTKLLFTGILFLASYTAKAQFCRTFDHGTEVQTETYSSNVGEIGSDIGLYSLTIKNLDTLKLTRRIIDTQGNLLAYKNFEIALPGELEDKVSLKASQRTGNTLNLLYATFSNGQQKIGVLKLDELSGNFIDHVTLNETFTTANLPAIVSNNEFITYQFSTSGIKRISVTLTNFSSVSTEVVDNSVNPGSGFNYYMTNKRNGQLFTFNGHESFYANYTGINALKVYERSAPNTFVQHTTSVAMTTGASDITNLSTGNFAFANNNKIHLLNANLDVIASQYTPNSRFADIEEWNGVIFSLSYGSNPTIDKKERTFSFALDAIDSNAAIFINFSGYAQLLNKLSVFGAVATNTTVSDYNGMFLSGGNRPFLQFDRPLEPMRIEEYVMPFSSNHFSIQTGLGNDAATYNMIPGKMALYNDSISSFYQVKDIHMAYKNGANLTNNLQTSGQYFQTELAGPYTLSAYYTPVVEAKFNRPFYITRDMIEQHIDSVQSGSSFYQIPRAIKDWPGNGNPAQGQAAQIAPFVDVNNNNIYEPHLGDYPVIYGEECIFTITHDAPLFPQSSQLEYQSFVYRVHCDTSSLYDDVIFKKMRIYARGQAIDSLLTFTFSDIDLGNYNDDYVGTNVDLGLIYAYNGDLFDEPNSGRPGFGNNLYSVGILSLKGPAIENNSTDDPANPTIASGIPVNAYGLNDGIVDNETYTLEGSVFQTGNGGFPSNYVNPEDFEQLSQGNWTDGSTRYFSNTTIASKYMFSASSDPLNYSTAGVAAGFEWSEYEPTGVGSVSNASGDRRTIGYNGKHSNSLNINEYVEKEYALIAAFSQTPAQTIWDSPNLLFAKAQGIKDAYNSNNGACGAVFDPIEEDLTIPESENLQAILVPNPTSGLFTIQGLPANAHITVVDANGRIVADDFSTNEQWSANSSDWNGSMFFVKIQTATQTKTLKLVKL